MSKLLFYISLSAGLSVPLLPISNTVLAATPIEKTFKSIHQVLPAQDQAASSYFVRLDLDPVVVWSNAQTQKNIDVTEAAKAAYISSLKSQLQAVMAEVESAGFSVYSPVVATDVGFTVSAARTQIDDVSSLSHVKAVIPKPALKRQRTASTAWIGGDIAHNVYDIKGSGQTIAVIDTGIDYLHRDFLGSGLIDDFLANDPSIIEEGTFPTATVIGGYDFAGYSYDARYPETSTPSPDLDPLDDASHGSHVAGIAAGRQIGDSGATGIAPGASLFALKVFGAEGSTSLTSQAIEMAVDPNGDGDPSDAVSVINMSLGSPFGSPNSASSISAQNAVEAGVVVVASAGNSGNDIPYISGAPGSAEGVIAVASSIPGGVDSFFLRFNTIEGVAYEVFAPYASISPALESVYSAPLTTAEPFDACSPLTNSFNGGIAFITRGSCGFTDKLTYAAAAGASAAVVVNNTDGAAIVMGGSAVSIPAAMVTLSEGKTLLAELSNGTLNTTFDPSNTREDPRDDDVISDFSSRGPGPTGLFKPDVTAPGDKIESANAGTGTNSLTISGTSMAAPQVAGMAALLLEKFPELGPKAIKAIIQNTARPARLLGAVGTPPLSLQGTGIVDIDQALNATAYAAPGGVGFGLLNPGYNAAESRYIEVTNFSSEDQRFSITVEPNNRVEGVVIDVPQEVYVAAGQTANVPLTLRVQASQVGTVENFNEHDGWVVFTSDKALLRVGYTSVIEPASVINIHKRGDGYNLQNVAFGDAEVYGFTASDSEKKNLGFTMLNSDTAQFALNADSNWTHLSQYLMQMDIDVNEDAVIDYTVYVADLNTLSSTRYPDVTGTIASAIFNHATKSLSLLYLADADQNSSVLQFMIDIYGPFGFLDNQDTSFDYSLSLVDLYADESEYIASGTGKVDVSRLAVFDNPAVALPGQESVTIMVDEQAAPIFFMPTESTPQQRTIKP